MTSFPQQILGRRMLPPRGEGTQLGCEDFKVALGLATQSPAEDVAHLCLGGMPVPCGPALEAGEQIVVEISHAETGHCTPQMLSMPAMIAFNGLICNATASPSRNTCRRRPSGSS